MTGEIVNLRTARKRKQRAEREAQADRNRFEHGRTKAERRTAKMENLREQRAHEGGRRQLPGPDGDHADPSDS